MPDLNKQTLINLLIDSPLREPIKINLIDIVNNTNDVDLPKTFSTIAKELEIFQKATERRMKLADETIAKLGGTSPAPVVTDSATTADPTLAQPSTTPLSAPSLPPLPPLPTPPVVSAASVDAPLPSEPSLSVPPLDLPPMPTSFDSAAPVAPVEVAPSTPAPVPTDVVNSTPASGTDEDALKEIQKELDALKTAASEDAAPAPTPQT